MNLLSDAELIGHLDRVAAGESQALKRLYDATAGRLYGVALQVLRDPDLAQDALQEAFLQVWRNAGDYRASLSPPVAWLGLIVRSRALDLLRRRRAARADSALPMHGDDDGSPGLLDQLATDAPGPAEQLQASQLANSLQHCLTKLEHRQREAVALAYLRDLSHSELAAQLAVPLGTVKSWVRRGLLQLRGCLSAFTREAV